MISYALAALIALAAPLMLLPIEQLLPHSYWLEEVFKVGLVWYVYQLNLKNTWVSLLKVGLLGLMFALSETILYLMNFFILANFSLLGQRLLWTSLLHIVTILVIYLCGYKSKIGLGIGFILAVGLHLLFNEWFLPKLIL